MMTARSADDPVTISVAVSMIGWVKLNATPGMLAVSRRASSSTSSAFVRPARQVSYGRRSTSSSLRFGPNGSVPESFRPVWEATRLTSGDSRISRRIRRAISADFSTEMPAGRLARIQMTPSSSWGRNSVPSELPR